MAKHVAVLMGGWSSERPVSLNSGKQCADALEAAGYRVTRVDVARDVAEVLATLKPDVAFNALHGPFGEDGCIQGILEILAIPYTHSGVLASALAMNKPRAKDVMRAAGIPVAQSVLVNRFDAAKAHVMPPPYVVKPPNEGSSFGVLIVREDAVHPPQQLYADDWPYWVAVGDRPHLVIPHSFTNNDNRLATAKLGTANDFYDHLSSALRVLHAEGNRHPRMMTVSLHSRISGQPARFEAVARFLEFAAKYDGVWFAGRSEIARHWMATHPAGRGA